MTNRGWQCLRFQPANKINEDSNQRIVLEPPYLRAERTDHENKKSLFGKLSQGECT